MEAKTLTNPTDQVQPAGPYNQLEVNQQAKDMGVLSPIHTTPVPIDDDIARVGVISVLTDDTGVPIAHDSLAPSVPVAAIQPPKEPRFPWSDISDARLWESVRERKLQKKGS